MDNVPRVVLLDLQIRSLLLGHLLNCVAVTLLARKIAVAGELQDAYNAMLFHVESLLLQLLLILHRGGLRLLRAIELEAFGCLLGYLQCLVNLAAIVTLRFLLRVIRLGELKWLLYQFLQLSL